MTADRMPAWRPRQRTRFVPAQVGWMPRLRFTRWHLAFDDAATTLEATQAQAELVIRPACAADRSGLERLGQLESTTVTGGGYVVAETDGELVAAVPVGGGEALADPFRPTRDVVSLLRLRAKQLGAVTAGGRRAA